MCNEHPRTKLQRCGRARVRYDYLNDTKSFQRNIGYGIEGEKLGIHAYGQVGRNVARIAKDSTWKFMHSILIAPTM